MSKGDRERLKADPDDGVTKVAHLLLEALSMSTLSGAEKGLVLFLWRRTYGWVDRETGEPFKDDAITLAEWAAAIDSTPSYASKLLKKLIETNNVILRTEYSPGRTPRYAMNTLVETWKGCLNVQGLYERAKQGLYKSARVGLHKSARVDKAQDQSQSALSESYIKHLNLTVNLTTDTGNDGLLEERGPGPPGESSPDEETEDPHKARAEQLVILFRNRFPLQNGKQAGGAVRAFKEFRDALRAGFTFEEYKAVIDECTEPDLAPWEVTREVKKRRRERASRRDGPDANTGSKYDRFG